MCPDLVLFRHQCVESFPRLADRRMDLIAKGNAVELVEHGLLVSFYDAVGLRALGPGSGMVHILDGDIEFAFGMLGIAAIIYAAIGQHAREPHLLFAEEGHSPIVQEFGRRDRRLAIMEFGERQLRIRVDKSPLKDAVKHLPNQLLSPHCGRRAPRRLLSHDDDG